MQRRAALTGVGSEAGTNRGRRRPWLRFSLRTMLLVVACCGFLLALACNAAHRQRLAIETLRSAGSGVDLWYDFETEQGSVRVRSNPSLPGPAWLRNMVGIDYLASVVDVRVGGSNGDSDSVFGAIGQLPRLQCIRLVGVHVTDHSIARLRHLTKLRQLVISETCITDAGWEPLTQLSQLQSLALCGSNIDDVTLARVAELTDLHSLSIDESTVTDAGLRGLCGLRQVEDLDLSMNGHITDAGMRYLHDLSELETLDVRCTSVSDAGLGHLESLSGLKALDVAHTKITDAGLRHLKYLYRLENLDVECDYNITDAGMQYIKDLPHLKSLNLGLTHVTAAAVRDLQQAIPQLQISRP